MANWHLVRPEWLWAIAIGLPLVALFSIKSGAVGGVRKTIVVGFVRALAVLLCAIALAQPVIDKQQTIDKPARVVVLTDESGSVGPDLASVDQMRAALLDLLGKANATTDDFRFAGKVWKAAEAATKAGEPSVTDIEAAIDLANGKTMDVAGVQVVLLTDARGTRGDAPSAAGRIALRGGKVSVVPVGKRLPLPPRVAQVEPPVMAKVGEAAAVKITVAAEGAPVRGIVRLRDPSGKVVDERELPVDGKSTVLLRFTPREDGLRNYTAEFVTTPDTSVSGPAGASSVAAAPTTQRQPVPIFVDAPPKILLCDNFPYEAAAIERALLPLHTPVQLVTPAEWPTDLSPYAAVILSDLAGSELTPPQRAALRAYVEQVGGGLVFVGGGNVQAMPWQANPISEMLPVAIQDRPIKIVAKSPDVAVCFVIDRSGSMQAPLPAGGGVASKPKIQLVKEAINASVSNLPAGACVSVVAFDNAANVIVDNVYIDKQSDRDAIIDKVNGIRPQGGTNMATGLEAGLKQLQASNGSKYLVVLSDGESRPPPTNKQWEDYANDAAADHIQWTSIGVGNELADPNNKAATTLRDRLAKTAGGVYFFCGTADQVPNVFMEQAAKIKRVANLKQEPFRPTPGPDLAKYKGPPIAGMPQLSGLVYSKLRPDAELYLIGREGLPLLAAGTYGLGKVIAFTSDNKNDWGDHWVQWPQLSQFWTNLLQQVMRTPKFYSARVVSRTTNNQAMFLFRVRDPAGRSVPGLTGSAKTFAEGTSGAVSSSAGSPGSASVAAAPPATPGAPAEGPADWKQTGPGEYLTTVDLPANTSRRTVAVEMRVPAGPQIRYAASVAGTNNLEMTETGPDLSAAEEIARAGNGVVTTDLAALASLVTRTQAKELKDRQDLWNWFVMAVILLLPVDIGVRKWME